MAAKSGLHDAQWQQASKQTPVRHRPASFSDPGRDKVVLLKNLHSLACFEEAHCVRCTYS